MDAAEQLKFIVDFANMDLQATREGDWINLQEDFSRFHPAITRQEPGHTGLFVFVPEKNVELKKYPKLKFVPLQNELKAILFAKFPPAEKFRMTDEIKITIRYVYGSKNINLAFGEHRDLFLQRTMDLLENSEISSKIRQCPECEKFFLRVRRQLYCSAPCVDKANKRDWLKTPAGKRYLKKTKKKRRSKKDDDRMDTGANSESNPG